MKRNLPTKEMCECILEISLNIFLNILVWIKYNNIISNFKFLQLIFSTKQQRLINCIIEHKFTKKKPNIIINKYLLVLNLKANLII